MAKKPHIENFILSRLPMWFQMEATTSCNLRCALCSTHDTPRGYSYLEMSYLENVLESCNNKVHTICFHALGEPLMHPGIFALVKKCSDVGINTVFSTNGMLIHQYIDQIFDSGLNKISVSLDGVEKSDYEKYRIGGNFNKVLDNIKLLIEQKKQRQAPTPEIDVKTIMFSYNEDRKEEVVAFLNHLQDLGADSIRLKQPNYWYFQTKSAAVEKFLTEVEPEDKEREYSRLREPEKLYRHQKICPLLLNGYVWCDGNVVACCMDHMGKTAFGNLNESSFAEIWSSAKHREIIQLFMEGNLDICNNCTLSGEVSEEI